MKILTACAIALTTLTARAATVPDMSYSCELEREGRKGGRVTCVVTGNRCDIPTPECPGLSMHVECRGFELHDLEVDGFIGAPINSGKNIIWGVEGGNEAYLHIKGDEPVGSGFAARLFTVEHGRSHTYTGSCTINTGT